jgi:hypothetical protein
VAFHVVNVTRAYTTVRIRIPCGRPLFPIVEITDLVGEQFFGHDIERYRARSWSASALASDWASSNVMSP